MSLQEYARKRRFGHTPEPVGATGSRRSRRPIFVVQLHHASVRHYDFRLEMDGALKSWAVPKGPSLRAGEKRLAVQVEDHPLEYATFAGDIPAGHYGAGHVDVFDHGVWSCDGDPLEALAAGKIDFVLHGGKLGGGWKLIRTAKPAAKPQWLLLKRDDEYAADAEADDLVDAPAPAGWKGRRPSGPEKPVGTAAKPGGAKSAARKSTTAASSTAPAKATGAKSARATAGPSPARRRKTDWHRRAAALDGARPLRGDTGFAPQLATLRGSPPTGDHWLHELKWDGYRLLARIDDGKARLRSRNGLDWTADYPEIVVALEGLGVASASLDGELIALDAQGRNSFSALQRTIEGTANATLRYVVFDLPSLAGIDLTGTRLDARKALLEELLAGAPQDVLAYSQHIVDHGAEVFAASRKQAMEGIISKAIDAPYTPGRSSTWLKIKHAQTDEFIVVGFTAPKGSRVGFGSLLVATRDAGQLKYLGRVGTGFDDALLRDLGIRLRRLSRDEATVSLPPHVPFAAREVTWVAPELVVEVAFRGWGKEGLLRQASYQRMREDKDPADVGASEVEGTKVDRQNVRDQATARLTSPDKLIYPAEKITKQQVAEYYRAVAARLLPEVVQRPLSLLRCPDGVQGQCFFQKHHAASLGGRVHAVAIKEKGGTRAEYVYIDDLDGLLDLVQMNVLELHPWGARIEDVEHPDRLVFDLDPGDGVPWSAVRAGARDVRARLDEIGLASFLRLSGGKGVHVVVPIAPGPGWSETKAFCEAFADAMATHAPDRYVATASKAKRGGVIFIDWLRNSRGATSVASWSLRARPGAAVAMPLRWDELGRTRSGADYPLARALRRAASLRGDPWAGWQDAQRQELAKLSRPDQQV
jgi:bifunctional non-homologous end joining protein LigD